MFPSYSLGYGLVSHALHVFLRTRPIVTRHVLTCLENKHSQHSGCYYFNTISPTSQGFLVFFYWCRTFVLLSALRFDSVILDLVYKL